jgi:Anthranilate/para-aminobenzoate synthases component II
VRAGVGVKVLLVDHEDSFVNTLADYFRQEGAEVTTLRHGFPDRLLDDLAPDLVVLSPGPGRPKDFATAALLDAIEARNLPVFGVCLGLQAMVEHSGGELALLPEPAHGKPGQVKVAGGELLAGLPDEFTAARYHSLHATADRVRGGFQVTALTGDVVMAIEDRGRRRWAVQFTPSRSSPPPARRSPDHRQRAGDVPRHPGGEPQRLSRSRSSSGRSSAGESLGAARPIRSSPAPVM